jgi:CRISPR-associated protein Cas5d
MKTYAVSFEIAGPTAMWTRPDTGDAPASGPTPSFSAAKGLFEAILWLKSAVVVPTRVEICRPLLYHAYTTNYGGPLRETEQIRDGNSYQLVATVLINVCYRLYAEVRPDSPPEDRLGPRARERIRGAMNGAHAYQEMFERRLRRGQCHAVPALGWREFVPDYVGPLRPETRACEDINLELPAALHSVFPLAKYSRPAPRFVQNVAITAGVLHYAP